MAKFFPDIRNSFNVHRMTLATFHVMKKEELNEAT